MKKSLVIHPFLFAVFPILFLYSHNIIETPAKQILIPIGASLILALVLWAFLTLILRDMLKAGLATTIFLLSFFFYGRFYELLAKWGVFVPGHEYLLPMVLMVFGYSVYFIKLARRDFKSTTLVLNVVALVLVILNVSAVTTYQIRTALSSPTSPAEPGHETATTIDPEKQKTMPDIYLIILDEYSHPDTMREYYDYDNSQFVNNLTEKGFFVADGSTTRTGSTYYSVASTLNMEYISKPVPKEIACQKIANNKVADFLKSNGYKYVYFESQDWGWDINADLDLYSDSYEPLIYGFVTTDFMRFMCNTTMLRPFYDFLFQGQYEIQYRRQVIDTIEHLKKAPEIEGPKFVFTYLICPHEPFVFGANREHVDAINWANYEDKRFYLGQYIFITREIERAIEALLEKSQVPPIIIVQSDHGIRPHHLDIEVGRDEWKKILNAYYLPGGGKELLYDSISPVNSFRLIFNHYFNADYDLLED